MDKIYTRNEAADIIEMFEQILIENNISVPSPEDAERDKKDNLGLYGSVYFNLLDDVEKRLTELIKEGQSGKEVIEGRFS